MKVNFRTSDFRRGVADAGALMLKNRYFEQNPFLSDDGAALLARPGMKRMAYVGSGPIRGMESQPGSFGGALFVVSGDALFKIDNQLNQSVLTTGLHNPQKGFVNMAITGRIEDVPEYCFIADGKNLLVYIEDGYALNTLSGQPANNNMVSIDGIYYRWTSGSVNTGTPAGTSSNPWLVALGLQTVDSYTNLANAINLSGVAGTDYSTAVTEHPSVMATGYTANIMPVRAKIAGVVGNNIAVTENGAALAWDNPTLTLGGTGTVTQVYMPEDIGVIDVAVIQSHVIVIPAQEDGFQGRFYWIEPGETTVDPLNFATAERSPDGVYGVQVFGDQFWLPGESTTEVWYVTGDSSAPMRRVQGVVFDRGSWENTAKAIHETMVVVDADGGVFLIKGGAPQRVSTPDIEEEIRKAMARQNTYLF